MSTIEELKLKIKKINGKNFELSNSSCLDGVRVRGGHSGHIFVSRIGVVVAVDCWLVLASFEPRTEPARYPEKDNNCFLALLCGFFVRSVLKLALRVVVSCGIIYPRLVLFLPQEKTQYFIQY